MSRKCRNWYRIEVDEEIKGVDSRDKVKHNERSNQLFFEMMMVGEQEQQRMKSEYCEDVEQR